MKATTYFACLALISIAAGCGSDGVDALGNVTIEGAPATQGRITFLPVGGGKRAFGLVNDQGQFALSTTEGPGAPPGSYKVTFVQRPNEQVKKELQSQLRGVAVNAADLKVTYTSPPGASVEIPDSGLEGLVIGISDNDGWSRSFGD